MPDDDVVRYAKSGAVATITLNRPDKQNAIRADMMLGFDAAMRSANWDGDVRVIVLEGAGDSFCSGFDFSGGLEHHGVYKEDGYDPGMDMYTATNQYTSGFPMFMGLWRGLKPTIAKIHGYCLGAGSELALCADLVIASDDARFGTPYSRVWGCHLTGMWVYRLGLSKAKVLRAHRRVDQRKGGGRDRADQLLPSARRARRPGRHPGPEDLDRPADAARGDEAHRQPGLRQHGPAEHPDARADPRRDHAQHP
jgi:enoyl-CoA hydratase/carnithine racemase